MCTHQAVPAPHQGWLLHQQRHPCPDSLCSADRSRISEITHTLKPSAQASSEVFTQCHGHLKLPTGSFVCAHMTEFAKRLLLEGFKVF